MANPKRPVLPKLFFLDEKLYKRLYIDRGNDEVECWDIADRKRVILPYVYTRDHHDPAYTMDEAALFVNRSRGQVKRVVYEGNARCTAFYRSMENNVNLGPRWSPRGIMELRDYFASQHRGPARRDGRINAQAVPTRQELRAMLEHGVMLYIKNEDGEFIPTWKA